MPRQLWWVVTVAKDQQKLEAFNKSWKLLHAIALGLAFVLVITQALKLCVIWQINKCFIKSCKSRSRFTESPSSFGLRRLYTIYGFCSFAGVVSSTYNCLPTIDALKAVATVAHHGNFHI